MSESPTDKLARLYEERAAHEAARPEIASESERSEWRVQYNEYNDEISKLELEGRRGDLARLSLEGTVELYPED